MSLERATAEQTEQNSFNVVIQTILLIISDQNNMAKCAKRALANVTVLDSLAYLSMSLVKPVSAKSFCVNSSKIHALS